MRTTMTRRRTRRKRGGKKGLGDRSMQCINTDMIRRTMRELALLHSHERMHVRARAHTHTQTHTKHNDDNYTLGHPATAG